MHASVIPTLPFVYSTNAVIFVLTDTKIAVLAYLRTLCAHESETLHVGPNVRRI